MGKNKTIAMDTVGLELSEAQFNQASQHFIGARGLLSPLAEAVSEKLPGKTLSSLQKSGVVDQNGNFSPQVEGLFRVLLNPLHVCEVSFYNQDEAPAYAWYYSPLSDVTAAISTDKGKLQFSSGCDPDSLLNRLATASKTASQGFPALASTLLLGQALHLAALCDLTLQKWLKPTKTSHVKGLPVFAPQQVSEAVASALPGSQWICLGTLAALAPDSLENFGDAAETLAGLTEFQWVVRAESGYSLSADAAAAIGHLKKAPSLVHAQTLAANGSFTVNAQHAAAIMNDGAVLLFATEQNGRLVQIKACTTAELADCLKRMVETGESVYQALGFKDEVTAATISCPQCGQPAAAEELLCAFCGATLVLQPAGNEEISGKASLKARLSRKPVQPKEENHPEKISKKGKGCFLPLWYIILFVLVTLAIVFFTYTTFNPLALHLRW